MVMPQPAVSGMEKIRESARKIRERAEETTLRGILSKHFEVKPDEPYLLSGKQAQAFGFDIPEDWQLKAFKETTDEGKDVIQFSELTPSGWEIAGEDLIISPEGQKLTIEETREMRETFPEWGELWQAPAEAPPEATVSAVTAPKGFIWDFDTGQYMPATLDLEVTKKFYKEHPEFLPEGVSPALTTAEAEELIAEQEIRQEETTRAFVNLFPELEPEEGQTYEQLVAETMTQVTVNEEIKDWFTSGLLEKGRTPETERLLEQFGFTDKDITEFFGTYKFRDFKPEPVPLRTDWWTLDYWKENFFRPYGGTDLKGKAEASFIAGIGDLISTSAGTARWLGYDDIGSVLSAVGTPLQQVAPPDTSGEFEVSDLLNPEFYATKVTRTIPFALSLAPLAIGGFYGGAGVAAALGIPRLGAWIIGGLAGAALSRPAESALEAGQSYDDAIARGLSEKEAKEEANEVFTNNLKLAGLDAFQIGIALAPTPGWVPKQLVASGLAKVIQVGGKMVIVGLTEGGEEVYQDMVQRHARGEEWKLDPVSKEVFALGMVMGVGMGLGGDVISSVVEKAQGKMPPELKEEYNRIVRANRAEGQNDTEARMRALDTIIDIPEGEKVVNEAVRETAEEKKAVTPEVTGISPQKSSIIQDTISSLASKGFAPNITSFSIDKTIGETAKGKYIGKIKAIVFRSEVDITPQTVEHELLHGVIAEARTKIGDDFLIDYAKIAGFTGKDLPKAIRTEFTVRSPISEDFVSMMRSYLRGEEIPSAFKSFFDNFTARLAIPKAPVTEKVTPPITEPGMPEAGYQPSMIEGVAEKEVRPAGKGRVTQISMEDQLRLEKARQEAEQAQEDMREAYEAQAELEEFKVLLETDPVANLRFNIGARVVGKGEKRKVVSRMVSIDQLIDAKEKEFAYNDSFTPAQAKAIKPNAVFSEANKLKNGRIKSDAVLDELAEKYTGGDIPTFIDRVNQIRDAKQQIKEAQATIRNNMISRPLEALPEPTEVSLSPTGTQMLTPEQITRTLELFGKYIENPSALNAWELTRELRREERGRRAEALKARAEQLMIEQGLTTENAVNQAIQETMSGELPGARTDYLDDLTDKMREALFDKVYLELKNEPYEMMSTVTALTNALLGKPIPREPGVKGGSAFTRLQKVFGDQPAVLKAIETISEESKPLENIVEGIYHEIGREPIPVDQETADYLRVIGKAVKDKSDLKIIREYRKAHPVKHEAQIMDAFGQLPLMPRPIGDDIVKTLKEIGMLPVDIGNFLRANKASFDFSFWRQQAPLITSHPISFIKANLMAWKSLWSQKSAEASWNRITRASLYQIYEECASKGGDFLRPLELKPGTAQWRGVEEFGYLTGERLLPKITSKLPWVKISARAFETGANEHNWEIFTNYYRAMLKLNEKYASGRKKLKVGESFDVTKEMVDFSKMLSNFTGRGSLGKFAVTAPELSAFFFAPRLAIGRLLSVKDLVNSNPRVRLEAWKNASSFVGMFGGIVLLGAFMGWWEVEKDPRNAEYMSIRIGNTRIDPWGGYRQFLVFFTRAITGTGVSSVTGAEYEADPLDLIQTFIRGKASPLASLILDFWRGKNFIGEEVDVSNKKQWVERVAPFAIWDIYEAYIDDPTLAKQVALPAIVGFGVQTYTGDWSENFKKLGIPKYPENTTYGLTEPYYDTADLWADTIGDFKGVDPTTLTEAKGFPKFIRFMVETRDVKDYLSTLPNEALVKINAEPTEGATFADYYGMWKERQKLVAAGDDAELTLNELQPDGSYKSRTYKGEDAVSAFDRDERTRNANLGNFSQRQFALLNEYWAITDKKEQAEFLEKHQTEIGVNARNEYLKAHPKENAMLALWGQANTLITKEAYSEFNSLLKEYDIPDNAVPEMLLPPVGSIDTHFKRIELQEAGKIGSPEEELLLLEDYLKAQELGVQSYAEWHDNLQVSDKTVEYWQLRVDNQALYDKLKEIEEDKSLTKKQREDALAELKVTKVGDETFGDVIRRVEAMGKGTRDNPIPEETVNLFVEHKRIGDEFGGTSLETKLNRYDNNALNDFLMNEDYWGTPAAQPLYGEYDQAYLDNWLVPRWRLEVQYSKEDDEYEAILDQYKGDDETREIRNYLYKNGKPTDYCMARKQIEAYEKEVPVEYHNDYISWSTNLKLTEKPDYYPEDVTYYEKSWFLMENEDFYKDVYVGILENDDYLNEVTVRGNKYRDEVPTRPVLNKYLAYLDLPLGKRREDYRRANRDLDAWLLLAGKVSVSIEEKGRRSKLTPLEELAETLRKIRD